MIARGAGAIKIELDLSKLMSKSETNNIPMFLIDQIILLISNNLFFLPYYNGSDYSNNAKVGP